MMRSSLKSGGSGDSKKDNLPEETKSSTAPAAPIIRKKSLLEHLESKLSTGDSKAFIYRLTVVGSHDKAPDDLFKFKDKLITDINTACYDEPATGLLAIYPQHFLHLIEGSEDTLNKYLQACSNEFESEEPNVGVEEDEAETEENGKNSTTVNMRILSYVRVFTRTAEKWNSMIREDPGEFDLLSIVHGYRNRLFEFIKKIWILSSVVPIFMQPEEFTTVQNMLEFQDPEDQLLVQEATKLLEIDLQLELNKYFPTTEMLQYFMKPKQRFPPLKTPKEHIQQSWNLPQVIFDSETVWPIPSRLARYD